MTNKGSILFYFSPPLPKELNLKIETKLGTHKPTSLMSLFRQDFQALGYNIQIIFVPVKSGKRVFVL